MLKGPVELHSQFNQLDSTWRPRETLPLQSFAARALILSSRPSTPIRYLSCDAVRYVQVADGAELDLCEKTRCASREFFFFFFPSFVDFAIWWVPFPRACCMWAASLFLAVNSHFCHVGACPEAGPPVGQGWRSWCCARSPRQGWPGPRCCCRPRWPCVVRSAGSSVNVATRLRFPIGLARVA
jgi:hypothetical protein